MKTWVKILVVFIGGGLVWGLAYCSSIWPSWAIILASLSSAVTGAVGVVTGFTGPKTT